MIDPTEYTKENRFLVSFLLEDKHNIGNKRPDIERAKKKFGHDPKITLEEGVPNTIEWMKSVYSLS